MESFYKVSDGGRFDATRLKLALFDEKTVEDIIDLVTFRGRALRADIFEASTEADPPRVLGVIGPDFVKYNDVPSLLLGLSTMILAGLRQPKVGNDEYAAMLKGAYGLPEFLARYYANQIESYDKIEADLNRDGEVGVTEKLTQYKNLLEEGARRIVNNLANAFGAGTIINWDQNQEYDIDFLDELSSLGDVVAKLNRRNRLMAAQALISTTMNTFQTGDVEDGEVDSNMDSLIGDVFSTLGQRRLPPSIFGNMQPLAVASGMAATESARKLLNASGTSIDRGQVRQDHGVGTTGRLAQKVKDALTGKASRAMVLGAIPATAVLTRMLSKAAGDPTPQLYGQVHNDYGPGLAQAWLRGDIDGIAEEIVREAGDVDMAEISPDVIGEVAAELAEAGDIGSMDQEIGGIFTKMRVASNLRRLRRKQGRYKKKAAVQSGKAKVARDLARAKQARRAASLADYQEQFIDPEEMVNDDSFFDSSVVDGGGNSGNEIIDDFGPEAMEFQ